MGDGERSPPRVVRLRRRSEYLAVAGTHQRWATPAFVLQAGPRSDREVGLGFTASRRVGKAVARNRARRRLVEAARLILPGHAKPGYNYVIVARPAVLTCPFDRLLNDLRTALVRIVRSDRRGPARDAGSSGS